MEDCVIEEPDLVAAIMDGFHGDIMQQAEKRTFNEQEQKKAFDTAPYVTLTSWSYVPVGRPP